MVRIDRLAWIGVALVALALTGAPAMAQDAPGGGVPPRGPGGGGPRGSRGLPIVTVADIPVQALTSELKLTDDQAKKITDIRTKLEADSKPLRPAPGAPRDPANGSKLRELSKQAVTDINAVLTSDQQAKAPALAKRFELLALAGVPPLAYADIKLTPDQIAKLTTIYNDAAAKYKALAKEDRRTQGPPIVKDARDAAKALLTDDQNAVVKKFAPKHERGGAPAGAPAAAPSP